MINQGKLLGKFTAFKLLLSFNSVSLLLRIQPKEQAPKVIRCSITICSLKHLRHSCPLANLKLYNGGSLVSKDELRFTLKQWFTMLIGQCKNHSLGGHRSQHVCVRHFGRYYLFQSAHQLYGIVTVMLPFPSLGSITIKSKDFPQREVWSLVMRGENAWESYCSNQGIAQRTLGTHYPLELLPQYSDVPL